MCSSRDIGLSFTGFGLQRHREKKKASEKQKDSKRMEVTWISLTADAKLFQPI